ncbi:palindromic element RPE4 domain-containing protein [Rickettsia tamurae]|nr:palindromic element RPE4 domain-containing protein [Rickettsia tamurae]
MSYSGLTTVSRKTTYNVYSLMFLLDTVVKPLYDNKN